MAWPRHPPATNSVTEPVFVDIHTHSRAAGPALRIVNSDPDSFARDALTEPRLSLGLHPWQTAAPDIETRLDWIEQHASHPHVVALGECGLDRLRGAAPAIQEQCFVRHIAVAESLGKPLIIHCVRAFNELIRLKQDHRISVPVIVHGFNNRGQVARQLLRHGFWLSFGAALLMPGSAAAKALVEAPGDRFFLETDDSNVDINEVYLAAAQLRQTEVLTLKELMMENFRRVFGDE
ncbi:MAG: deoxyribonuclease [Proteobacteria bacterium]|nr:deoxyribonuclease [Pseudomonadota bacterium]